MLMTIRASGCRTGLRRDCVKLDSEFVSDWVTKRDGAVERWTGRAQIGRSASKRREFGRGSAKRSKWLAGVIPLFAVGAALIPTVLIPALHGRLHAAVVTPYPHDLAQVSFAVAGDVIPHEAVRQAAAAAGDGEQGWAALFSDVADVFEGADFGFVNLETPVAPEHSHGTKAFMFDAPVALPEALKASGIKIVSFANNHVMDQGWAGFTESREHLKEVGLLFAGTSDNAATAWQPVITEANGIKVGWLGMTRWLNGNRNPDKDDQPHVNFFPYPGEAERRAGSGRGDGAGGGEGGAGAVRSAGGERALGDRIRDGAAAGRCGHGAQDAGGGSDGDCGRASARAAAD